MFTNSLNLVSATAILTVLLAVSPVVSLAQEKTVESVEFETRFQIERDGDGFVRLDKKTGATSFCRRTNKNLVCRLAIEERNTYHDEIAKLQEKLTDAENRLESNNEQALVRPKDDVPEPKTDENAGAERDKFERELDKAMEITKLTMRRLFGVVKELQKEFGQ